MKPIEDMVLEVLRDEGGLDEIMIQARMGWSPVAGSLLQCLENMREDGRLREDGAGRWWVR